MLFFDKLSTKMSSKNSSNPSIINEKVAANVEAAAAATQLVTKPMSNAMEALSFPVNTLNKNAELKIIMPTHRPGEPDSELVADFVSSFDCDVLKILKKANPELLAQLMLPKDLVGHEAQKIAACFWLWLCVVDGKSTLPGML